MSMHDNDNWHRITVPVVHEAHIAQNSALQCPTGTVANPFSCLTESFHCWMHHKVVQELGSLPLLASWGQPAAQLLQGSHQGLLLNDHSCLSVAVCCCSEATKTNAASSEGWRGWSVARAAAIISSKTLARFRALAQNQARRGGWKLKVFADQELHPPHARQQALPAFSFDPTNRQSWEGSQNASSPPCNASKQVLWRCDPPHVVVFWKHNAPWCAHQPS